MTSSSNSEPEINQDNLYGFWKEGQQWKQKLQRKATHKALNIPEDEDMNINTSTTNNSGIGLGGLVAMGLCSTVPPIGLGLLGLQLLQPLLNDIKDIKNSAPAVSTQLGEPKKESLEIDAEVIFYDKDGNEINVPHISQRLKK